jgi:acyl-CoA synthetase (AMP-forming)/AMP-acid ligase II
VNVGVAVSRSARRYPGRVAVFEGERSLTYDELDGRTSRLANALLGRYRLERGDRVALLVRNRLEVIEVLGGVAKAGGVYVGLNFRMTPAEYDRVFENCTPRLLISEREFEEEARRLSTEHGAPLVLVDAPSYDELLASASARVPSTLHEVRPSDDFCIVYSSGTTGTPKGILFDHAAVVEHALAALLEYDYTPSSRWLTVIPHNSSVQIALVPSLTIGSAIGFLDARNFNPDRFVAAVERDAVTHSFLVPTQLYRLLEHVTDGRSLPTLETLGYGSSPIPPDRVGELVERFGPIFTQLYGMAEIASIGTMLRKSDHVDGLRGRPRLLSSCGQPGYAIDVRVVDDDGRDVEPGERGEVIFAGAYVMKGYFRDPDRTAETIVDGWVRSGDIAEVDEEGYLYIVDRKKDLIIRGGLNIAPTEIENVLYAHEAVLEVAVVGVPDVEWGEAITAVVALKESHETTGEELTAWCRESGLPTLKIPDDWKFVDALPKNAVGKIAKREIRRRFWSDARKV